MAGVGPVLAVLDLASCSFFRWLRCGHHKLGRLPGRRTSHSRSLNDALRRQAIGPKLMSFTLLTDPSSGNPGINRDSAIRRDDIQDVVSAPSPGAVPRAPRIAGPRRCLRVLVRQVVAHLAQEPIRRRDDPVVAALALGDEQLPYTGHPQAQHLAPPKAGPGASPAPSRRTGPGAAGLPWVGPYGRGGRAAGCASRLGGGEGCGRGRSRHGNDIGV